MKLLLDADFKDKAAFGPGTLGSFEADMRDVKATAKRGFAFAINEAKAGVSAVAAPVTLNDGAVGATIRVAGPLVRLDQERCANSPSP